MQKIIKKKWDLNYIYDLACQAKEAGDIDQAIKLSEKGLKEAKSQSDFTWRSKFELFTKEMYSNYTPSKLAMNASEVAAIVKSKSDITKIKGIGSSMAQKLHNAGINSIKQLSTCSTKILSHVKGIGLETAKKLIHSAKEYLGVLKNIKDESKNFINQQQTILEYNKFGNPYRDGNSYEKKIEEPERVHIDKAQLFAKKFSIQQGTHSYPRIKKRQSSQVDLINNESSIIEPVDYSKTYLIDEENEEEEIQKEMLEEKCLLEIEEKQNIKPLKKGIKELSRKVTNRSPLFSKIGQWQGKERIITEDAMSLETKREDILPKLKAMINNTANAEAFEIIPQDTKEFENILHNIDITLFKLIDSDNGKYILLIIPIKISPVRDALVVSEEKVKHFTKLEKNLLLEAYIVNLKRIPSTILENMIKKGDVLYFFQNYFMHDIIMDQNISDEISLYSGAAQFRVYINPILISDNEIQFIEKSIPFAYQRSSGVHFIHISQLDKLLRFLEKKYRAIEEYNEENPLDQKLDQIREKTQKKVFIFSIPFIGFGILLVILGLAKLGFLLQSFIELSYGIIGIYIGLIVFLWYKYHIKNREMIVQLLTPSYQKSVKLNNASLEIIYQELSDENMLQFGYECFGKVAKHKILKSIEEQQAKQYSVEKINNNYVKFFEKEDNSKYSKEISDFLND